MTQRRAVAVLLLGLLTFGSGLLTACGSEDQGGNTDPDLVDATEVPKNGVCRNLTPDDVARPANATETTDCTMEHTAETFATGELPATFDDVEYDDTELATYAYTTCSTQFAAFVGADESLVLRTTISWAWFRPSEKAWGKGARWYRCDVIGGNASSPTYRPLPQTAKGMLSGRPKDVWLSCARGASVAEGEKVPCSKKHDWRAVGTVVLGKKDERYPGDRVIESRSRAQCSGWVRAWLNYPSAYEFGYTFFHAAEWNAGIRRSVCWARITK